MLANTIQSTEKLETSRLKVCAKGMHTEELKSLFSDPKSMEFYPQFMLNAQLTIDILLAFAQKAGLHIFSIQHKAEGGIIGAVTFNNVEEFCKRIEVGYFLISTHWRKGYANEILKAIIECLKKEGWHRIEATVYSGNDASQKVLQKNGFTLEGVLRDKYIINGKYHDDIVYSIIVPEN